MLGLRVATQAGTLVLLTRLLGPGQYGNYAAAASLAIVLGTLPNLGAGYVLLSRATRDSSATADVWRYAWPLTFLLGVILLVMYLTGGCALIAGTAYPISLLLWIGAAELLLTPFSMLFSYALQSQERVPLSQFVQWLPLALRLAAAASCFFMDEMYRLPAFVMLQFLASLIGLIAAWRITSAIVQFDWRPRLATKEELKSGASYAAMLLVTSNPSELDKIVAARTVGAQEAGIYVASSRVMSALVMPVLAMLLAAQPRLFRHAGTDSKENHKLIRLMAILSLGWGALCGLFLLICSPLLPWVFGQAYVDSAKLMPLLAITPIFLSTRIAAGSILVALGRPLERLSFELGGILLLLACMLGLTPWLGVYGLIVAVIVAEAVMAMFGWILVRRQLTR